MEKKTPHYDLNLVKDDMRKGNYRITQTSFMHALSDFKITEAAKRSPKGMSAVIEKA
jgi:hypothetical protein